MAKFSEKFRRNMAPSFEFGFKNEYSYSVQALESISRKANKNDWSALKAEYTRMRDAAQKRLKRLQKSEFSGSKAAIERPEGFPKLKELDPRDLPYAMNDLFRFLKAKTSTVYGQRERMQKTIATFEKAGIEIEPKEYDTFISVLEGMRKNKILYGSDYAKELTDMILSTDKISVRSATAKSRMRKLMQIAHDAEKRNKFLEEVNKNRDAKYTAVSMDKTIKSFGW